MNILAYLQFLPLFTKLIVFIRQAQAEIRGKDTGAQKLQWVIANFAPVIEGAAGAGLVPQKLGNAITVGLPQIISLIVQLMNAVHGAVPPAVPVLPE